MRIGIYGGTFSPPHVGHVRAAEEFLRQMKLEKLLIIPAFIPPHKAEDALVSPELRYKMCEAAFTLLGMEISDIEIKRGGKSYTVFTLEKLRDIYPDGEFFMLCGADKLSSLDRWLRAEDIFHMCTPVYAKRDHGNEDELMIKEKIAMYREQFGVEVRHISLRTTELSSSEIRERIARGEDVSELVPPGVMDIICRCGLYK